MTQIVIVETIKNDGKYCGDCVHCVEDEYESECLLFNGGDELEIDDHMVLRCQECLDAERLAVKIKGELN